MSDPLDALEKSISTLRRAIRDASAAGDGERAGELRAQLRRAERAWDALIDTGEPAPAPPSRLVPDTPSAAFGSQLPAREHVHRALMLLGTPAAPKLIVGVHEAFFPGELSASKLSSLRRDEERSYRSSPGARPYYLCPALAHDLLTPVRALITVSTWPLEQRIIGPLSPRVDFLTGAIRVAEAVHAAETSTGGEPSPAALRLLWRFAANIPDALPRSTSEHESALDAQQVIDAAQAELDMHLDADRAARSEASLRARTSLRDAQQLFGAPPQNVTPLRARA
ncbi:hypothetical protein SAZ_42735 [Streptomyces noursei ZPM]|uniref:Uncharacterized protein n=2 Tax=Streptomyces noursei TaxID=1971 RepID=A0A401QRM9_STRNR|nr:hypothetical protein [Streptomyces noursei]AKA08269.1 hypothetical protein SAZ_00070 [Streptomyces noursei ZPM]AKA09327.1 hypothetical protein SAZ_42735 [Streptomyces noursei ZPM]EOS97841.1 hypothetical protein K530_41957 [Streptomyces noursei CCRC 11814]EXU92359.1 hypothetical protein P354_21155 [Streptomyces noursei PD-1]GCB88050.1 hypothetical protein SALB_00719 [Streptomyces noursei]